MKDIIRTALACENMVRVTAVVTTDMVAEAVRLHRLMPVGAAALGRALTAAAIMSNMLKNEKDRLTLQIKGDGPLGGILVTGDSDANVKGYVNNPACDLPIRADGKLDVSGAVGRGYLQVIKDIGLKEPYIGLVALVSGEIAGDLANYFAVSEQINSAIALGVLVNTDGTVAGAGGYMLQLMPGASEECITFLEELISILPSVTTLISEYESIDELILKIFENKNVTFLDSSPCAYRCDCSRERMEKNLITIGKNDLEELAQEPQTELLCHFCDKKYVFSSEEIKKLVLSL